MNTTEMFRMIAVGMKGAAEAILADIDGSPASVRVSTKGTCACAGSQDPKPEQLTGSPADAKPPAKEQTKKPAESKKEQAAPEVKQQSTPKEEKKAEAPKQESTEVNMEGGDVPENFPLYDDIMQARRPKLANWVKEFVPAVNTNKLQPTDLKYVLVAKYYPNFIREVCTADKEKDILAKIGAPDDAGAATAEKEAPKKSSGLKADEAAGASEPFPGHKDLADAIKDGVQRYSVQFKKSLEAMNCGANCHNCPNPDGKAKVKDQMDECMGAINALDNQNK